MSKFRLCELNTRTRTDICVHECIYFLIYVLPNMVCLIPRSSPLFPQPMVQCEPQQQLIQALRSEIRLLKAEVHLLRGQLDGAQYISQDIAAARAAVHSRLGSQPRWVVE